MDKKVEIKLLDLIGNKLCLGRHQGDVLYQTLLDNIANNVEVTLSFDGIEAISGLFINSSIGRLYGVFDEDRIKKYLHVDNINQDDIQTLKRYVDNAKKFFDRAGV